MKRKIIELNKQNVLWHGVGLFYLEDILTRGTLLPLTSQNFWSDGKRLKENHSDYHKSGRKYGWSMTRDFNVAKNFGGAVFVFAKDKIADHFKIEPFSWNYFFERLNVDFKKEKEEFVSSGGWINSRCFYEKKSSVIEEKIDELSDLFYSGKITKEEYKIKEAKLENEFDENNYFKLIDLPHGKELPLTNSVGFFLKEKSEETVKFEKNELFLGYCN